MNKYEKLIEHIINENDDAAKKLFHSIVVEKSRQIYENLMADDEVADNDDEDTYGGNETDDFVSDVEDDGMSDDEVDFGSDDDLEGDDGEFDMDSDDDLEGDEFGDDDADAGLEDRVLDLEDELDALKAEFDRLMDENGEGADELGSDEDEDIDTDLEISDDDGEDTDFGDDEDDADSDFDMDDTEDDQESDEADYEKDDTEIMREYVEKVKDFYKGEKSEGNEVGTGGTVQVNKRSVTDNMKNDMGGTNANIAKGGAEKNPDGQKPNGKAGGFVKPAQEIDVAKRQVNKPGGDKGAQKFYGKKAPSAKPEGSTTQGKMPVQKNSLLKGRK